METNYTELTRNSPPDRLQLPSVSEHRHPRRLGDPRLPGVRPHPHLQTSEDRRDSDLREEHRTGSRNQQSGLELHEIGQA